MLTEWTVTRTVSKVFNSNPQGSRLRGRPKHRWWNCVQTYIKKRKITEEERERKKQRTLEDIVVTTLWR
jgi:hypothetical protein